MKEEDTGELVRCEDIQSVLLEYAERELGDSRSALVREHIRQCDNCQAAFNDIMKTVSMLQDASRPDEELPSRLSDKHYARIVRALMHPVLDWIFVNHKLVSAIVVIIVLICSLFVLQKVRIWKVENLDRNSYRVYIGTGPAGVSSNDGPVIIWQNVNQSPDKE